MGTLMLILGIVVGSLAASRRNRIPQPKGTPRNLERPGSSKPSSGDIVVPKDQVAEKKMQEQEQHILNLQDRILELEGELEGKSPR